MCTTYLVSELISEFKECDVLGYPRLVRLNPNIPWKTRGNGAISIKLGKGFGKRSLIGKINGKEHFCHERGRNIKIENIKNRIEHIIEANAQFSDENTNPAYVVTKNKPPQSLYWEAVRDVVNLSTVKRMLREHHADFKGYKNKRGLIGASAACSWRPRDMTYEVIAYREKKRWGTKRRIDISSVIKLDQRFPSTFNNFDHHNKVVAIAPNSPCPVLFGIRGDKPNELPRAMKSIISEKKARWILFQTNQGTDEHLQKTRIKDITSYHSVITSGAVSTIPKTIEGGHVIFSIANGKTIDCAAYEPTKEFRSLVRKLIPGDKVTVYGGVRKKPITINIEKIKIEKLAKKYKKTENPLCPKCKGRMKSMGKNAGYRCPKCRVKVGEEKVKSSKVKRELATGLYEVPVCARRHLAKPIKRKERRK